MVCVCGFEEGHLVSDVKRVVTSLLYKWGLNQEFVVNPPITVEEDSNGQSGSFNPYSAGIDFRRQNLVSIDVKTLKIIYNGRRPVT